MFKYCKKTILKKRYLVVQFNVNFDYLIKKNLIIFRRSFMRAEVQEVINDIKKSLKLLLESKLLSNVLFPLMSKLFPKVLEISVRGPGYHYGNPL